jgi:hypothetical protein
MSGRPLRQQAQRPERSEIGKSRVCSLSRIVGLRSFAASILSSFSRCVRQVGNRGADQAKFIACDVKGRKFQQWEGRNIGQIRRDAARWSAVAQTAENLSSGVHRPQLFARQLAISPFQ